MAGLKSSLGVVLLLVIFWYIGVPHVQGTGSAIFRIYEAHDVNTVNDTLSSGTTPHERLVSVKVINTDTLNQTVIGNISHTMGMETIESCTFPVRSPEYVFWNDTYAIWRYPPTVGLAPSQNIHSECHTGTYLTEELPMGGSRWTNASLISTNTTQLWTFNITITDLPSTSLYGEVETRNYTLLNTMIVNNSLSSDAPLRSVRYERSNRISFDLNQTGIILGKTYTFSFLLRADVTSPMTSPILYKPRIWITMDHSIISSRTGEMADATSIPTDMLPPSVQFATVSTNTTAQWYYSQVFLRRMIFGSVYQVQDTPPVANFSAHPTSGMVPLLVQFNDTSDGIPTSWSWEFGDGQTDDRQNPLHLYNGTITGSPAYGCGIQRYTVNLTVSDGFTGDTLSQPDLITVGICPSIEGYPLPNDLDCDGLFDDLNGNGRKDFMDIVLLFTYLEQLPVCSPSYYPNPWEPFDFNWNGRIDFNDIVRLFEEI